MSTPKDIFLELLEAWETERHGMIYERSVDFDGDKAECAREKAEWIERWNGAMLEVQGLPLERLPQALVDAKIGTTIRVNGGKREGRWIKVEAGWANFETNVICFPADFPDCTGVIFE